MSSTNNAGTTEHPSKNEVWPLPCTVLPSNYSKMYQRLSLWAQTVKFLQENIAVHVYDLRSCLP